MGADNGGLRLVIIALFTVIEVGALAIWLDLVGDASLLSRASALGLTVLVVGLVVEHVLTDVAVNGIDLDLPTGDVLVFSVSEAALWALWLLVADRLGGAIGVGAAGIVLALLLVPQHTIEDNVLRGEALLSTLLDRGTVGFSLLEALGASLWLAFVTELPITAGLSGGLDPGVLGVTLLAVLLFAEHNVGVSYSRRL